VACGCLRLVPWARGAPVPLRAQRVLHLLESC
jgi:hypothetical protein